MYTIDQSRTLYNSLNATGYKEIDMESYVVGEIHIPASFVSTTITAYSYSEALGGWRAHDTTLTVAPSKVYAFPAEWAAAKDLQLVSNADDSSRPVGIILKGWPQ